MSKKRREPDYLYSSEELIESGKTFEDSEGEVDPFTMEDDTYIVRIDGHDRICRPLEMRDGRQEGMYYFYRDGVEYHISLEHFFDIPTDDSDM